MTTVTLHTGTVSHSGTPGSSVGSGAFWDDGFDTTYIESDTTEGAGTLYVGYAPLDVLSLPGGVTVNSVTLNMRAADMLGTDTPARVSAAVFQGSFPPFGATYSLTVESYVPTGGWQVETSGLPTSLTHTFDATDYTASSTSLSALVSALTGGASVWAYSLSNSGHTGLTVKHRFYELSVTVDYTLPVTLPLPSPPQQQAPGRLRVYPRSDTSALRIWPPPRSRQGSNRLNGYL